MKIVCTGDYEVPADFVAQGGRLAPSQGCGREIDVPDTPWDVKTDVDGNTISEHRQVNCPFCGVGTFIERTV